MRLRNRLWNPEHPQPKQKQTRKPPTDPLCEQCPNYKYCKGLCPPMQWINGNAETKEVIQSKPIFSHGIEQLDYNQYLAESITIAQATDIDKLESIRSIKDYRIIFLYRDELYNKNEDNPKKGLIELQIAKHRNGETANMEAIFDAKTQALRNRARV